MISGILKFVETGVLTREQAITILNAHAVELSDAVSFLMSPESIPSIKPSLISESPVAKARPKLRVIASPYEDATAQLSEEALISSELTRPKAIPKKAGELCAFTANFVRLVWEYYPGKRLCSRADAIKAAAELTVSDYADFLRNFTRWAKHWQELAATGKDQYIHRLPKFLTYKKWTEQTPTERYASKFSASTGYSTGRTGEPESYPGASATRHFITAESVNLEEQTDPEEINDQLAKLMSQLQKELEN